MKRNSWLSIAVITLVAGFGLRPSPAPAVPSFARQTGLACNGCHTTPPELNAAGRRFKLLGFTDRADNTATVQNDNGTRHAGLDLLKALPISGMLEASFTASHTPQPGTQNGTFQIPQDVSLFLSGGWSTHVGSFVQITYDAQDDHFSMDNTDIRVTNKGTLGGHELIYGLTLNNNPTVEDIWHGTPAWGFPFVASSSAPSPTAAPLIQGGLAQDVAGVGGYTMWNDHLYLAAAAYRSNHIGTSQPSDGSGAAINIRGVAPYWRLAWQQNFGANNMLEVGTYGIQVNSTPNAVVGPEDQYRDWAVDMQLDQTLFIRDVLSLRASYVRETSTLDATYAAGGAAQSDHDLKMFQANLEYHFGNICSAAVGYQNVTGTADALLYAPAAVTGSANGSPDSTAYLLNLSWWPIQNLQFAAQYTGYTKFNGDSTNYDGSGRSASDNNTIYLLARFLF